jgi:hypothetical protein
MHPTLKHLTLQEGRYRLSVAHLLITIVVLFMVMPFVDQLAYGHFVETIVLTVVMLAAVNAVGGRRSMLIAAAVLATPAILTRWLYHLWPESVLNDLYLIAATAFVSFVIFQLLKFVLAAPQVNGEVLCAAVSIYLLLAVVWAFLYTLLARWQPDAFNWTTAGDGKVVMAGFTALYFSVQILTTITFGDILPVSNVARMLALVQSTSGVFYMAILVARLVGLYSSGGPANRS